MAEDNVIDSGISPEIIEEARSQGWVPKEEFKKDPKSWVDADVFVERGHQILPLVRKHSENLSKELAATKEQLKELRETAEEFKKYHDHVILPNRGETIRI